MARLNHRQIDRYDGQTIVIGNQVAYELGNYLGGGASGSVYQALDMSSQINNEKSVAIKILNPLGFKILSYGQLSKCIVASKGQPLNQKQIHGKVALTVENIWWLVHPSSEQVFAAYEDVSRGQLRELTLPRCIEVWGWTPLGSDQLSVEALEKMNVSGQSIVVSNTSIVQLPIVAPKYLKWLQSRATICREMKNMIHIGEHPNIVALLEVLELIQDSKAVLFLVLEFVNGGELFDRMKRNNGPGTSSDEFARRYFSQLLSGIDYCHGKGVVHRDLKPENLLLSDPSDTAILKIADFGLSAVVFAREGLEGGYIAADSNEELSDSRKQQQLVQYGQLPSPIEIFQTSPAGLRQQQQHYSSPPGTPFPVPLRRLRSVVGSPHYIAPEIVNHDPCGYDGRKVDMWSAGVILYSMLTGSLPFGGDLPSCPRYKRYKQWMQLEYGPAMREGKGNEIALPLWFFPSSISPLAGSLIVSLLHIDPQQRCTAAEALRHPWSTMDASYGSNSSGDIVYSNSSGQLKGVKGVKLFQSDEIADNYQQCNSSFSSTSSTSSQRSDRDKLKCSKGLSKDHKDKRLNSTRRPKSPPSPSAILLNVRPQASTRTNKIRSASSRSRSPEDEVEGDILKVLTSMSTVLSISDQNPLAVTDLSTKPNVCTAINQDKDQSQASPFSGSLRETSVPIISIDSNIAPYGCNESTFLSLPVPPPIESVPSVSRLFPSNQSSSGKRFQAHDYEEEEQRERYRCTLEQRQREKTSLLSNLQMNSKDLSISNSQVPTSIPNFISVDNEYDDAINEIHFK